MKIKYYIFLIVFVLLIASCRSKKKTVRETSAPRKEMIVKHKNVEPPATVKSGEKKAIQTTEDYIEQFKDVAMEEMRIFKIPASITLAQGILESSSGKSELTRKSNNHFGIKCHKGWQGKKTYHDDDEKGECFRVYKDPKTSYRDHSVFLVGRERYSKLFKHKKGDYISWAKGLSKAGYATDRRYPAKLIALIEKYELDKYDTMVLGKKFVPEKPISARDHIVQKGDTLYSLSKKYGVAVADLRRLNNLRSNDIKIGQILLISN